MGPRERCAPRCTWLHALVVSTGLLGAGCAGPVVHTEKPSPANRIEARDTALLLVDLRMPKTEVTVVGPAQQLPSMGEEALTNERARHRAFAQAFLKGLGTADAQVLPEIEAGEGPMPAGTRLLRVEVTDLTTVTDDRRGVRTTCGIFGGLTAGLAWLACTGARNEITQTARLEVRLYDVSGETTERIQRGGELVRVLDTSGMRPVYRQTHEARVESGHHIMKQPSDDDALAFAKAQGARLGQVAYQALAPEISEAFERLAAQRPAPARPQGEQRAVAPAPTSGGEAPAEAAVEGSEADGEDEPEAASSGEGEIGATP